MPVPPVVITTCTRSATAARSAAATGSPSGTTTGSSTPYPCARSHSTISGPPRSSYTPAAARFDAVTTRARRSGSWARGSSTVISPVLLVAVFVGAESSVRGPGPDAGAPALLALQPDRVHRRGRIERLDHVVQRETGDRHGGERLHLHPGAVGAAGGRLDAHLGLAHLEVHRHARERDGVAERDEVRRALGAQDPSDACGRQGVALGHGAVAQGGAHLGGGAQDAARGRHAAGDLLVPDVDHPRRPGLVDVGETPGALRGRHSSSVASAPSADADPASSASCTDAPASASASR